MNECLQDNDFYNSNARKNCPYFIAAQKFKIIKSDEPYNIASFSSKGWGSSTAQHFFSISSQVGRTWTWWLGKTANIDKPLANRKGASYRPVDKRLITPLSEELLQFLNEKAEKHNFLNSLEEPTISGDDVKTFMPISNLFVAQLLSAAHRPGIDPKGRATAQEVVNVLDSKTNLKGRISLLRTLRIMMGLRTPSDLSTTWWKWMLAAILYVTYLVTGGMVYFKYPVDIEWQRDPINYAVTITVIIVSTFGFLLLIESLLDLRRTSIKTSLPTFAILTSETWSYRLLGSAFDCASLMFLGFSISNSVSNSEHLTDNPLRTKVGHNNLCVLMDFPPEKYAAQALFISFALLASAGLVLDIKKNGAQNLFITGAATIMFLFLSTVAFFDVEQNNTLDIHINIFAGAVTSLFVATTAAFLRARLYITTLEQIVYAIFAACSINFASEFFASTAGCDVCLPAYWTTVTDYTVFAIFPLLSNYVIRPALGRSKRKSCNFDSVFPSIVQ